MFGETVPDLKTNISSSDNNNTFRIDATDLINNNPWIISDYNHTISTNSYTTYSNIEYDVTEISNPEFFKDSNTYMIFEFIRRIFMSSLKSEISSIKVSVSSPTDANNLMRVLLKNNIEILISGNDKMIRILYNLEIQTIEEPLDKSEELKEVLEKLIGTIKAKLVLD